MAKEFSFGQVEAVCAAMNRIASDKRVAFAGRLKALQKHEIVDPARRPGRGKAGTYTFTDLMRYVVALELMQCGLMPQMAARLVTGSWGALQHSIYLATHSDEEIEEWQEMPFAPSEFDWYWMLTPEALRDMSEEGEGKYDHMEAIHPVPAAAVAARIMADREIGVLGEGWRLIVLHGTAIAKTALRTVEFEFRYASARDLRAEIQEDFDRLKKALDEPLFAGVEEHAQKVFQSTAEAALHNMQTAALRARYFPSEAVLEQQARKLADKLTPYQLAYIRAEDLNGKETPDLKAMNELMGKGLAIPEMRDGQVVLELSPLGRTVQKLTADVAIPADAMDAWHAECRATIHEAVQRKIDRLLASDPDNPEDDEALDRWARHGGTPPLSEARQREVAKKFVGGMREATKDEPEMWDEFKASLGRIGNSDGDD